MTQPKKKPAPKVEAKTLQVQREFQITDNWTSEQVTVIRNMLGKDLNEPEFKLFLMTAKQLGADPLRKEIYATVFTDNKGNRQLTLISSIDYLRRMATSHPRYNGTSDAEFGEMKEMDVAGRKVKVPEYAKISIWLKGADHPVEATAYFEEYLPGTANKQFMWGKMPRVMIAKCAEALAIRKAFPKETGQVYTEEEREGMQNKTVSIDIAGKPLVDGLKELIEKKGFPEANILRKFKIEKLEDIDVKQGRLLFQTLQGMPDKATVKDAEIEEKPATVESELIHDETCTSLTGGPCNCVPVVKK